MLNEPLEMLDPSWRSATPLSLEEASPAYCWRSIYSAMHFQGAMMEPHGAALISTVNVMALPAIRCAAPVRRRAPTKSSAH